MDRFYNRLPMIYRKEDKINLLKNFLNALEAGGHDVLLEDILKLPDLLDIDKCPDKFLPLLAELFGYEYSAQIPAFYQRRILKVIVDLYKRKGTQSAIKFIAREISGFEAEIVENSEFEGQDISLTGWDISYANMRKFLVKLIAPEDTSDIQLKRDIAEILINQFLPTNSEFFLVEAYFFSSTKTLGREVDDALQMKNIVDKHTENKTFSKDETDPYLKIVGLDETHDLSCTEDGTSYLNSANFVTNSTMILNARGGFMTVTDTTTGTSYTTYD